MIIKTAVGAMPSPQEVLEAIEKLTVEEFTVLVHELEKLVLIKNTNE